MLNDYSRDRLIQIADTCLLLQKEKRPEIIRLNTIYDHFRKSEGGLRKKEADHLLFQRMYGTEARSDTELLKIRFWRTGQHVPVSREECASFGQAVGLSGKELTAFLQTYYDRADLVFTSGTISNDALLGAYQSRIKLLSDITDEYMSRLHPLRRRQLTIPAGGREHYLRHTYYMDAVRYMSNAAPVLTGRHVETISYETEFGRQMKLLGEIPRRVFIRHLFLLTQPYISTQRMNDLLAALGYLPLSPDHTTTTGSRLDLLLIEFLSLYEEQCHGSDPGECTRWLISAYQYLDRYLEHHNAKTLRFLYFKSLGSYKMSDSAESGATKSRGTSHPGRSMLIEKELLDWENLHFTLRKKYIDTPPAFGNLRQIGEEEERIRKMTSRYEKDHTFHLLSHTIPAGEPFAGRQEMLDEIRRRLTGKNGCAGSCENGSERGPESSSGRGSEYDPESSSGRGSEGSGHPVVLYGIGGMGKSTLARAYMRRFSQSYDEMLFLHVNRDICSVITDDSQVHISNLQYSQEKYGSRRNYFKVKIDILRNIAFERRLLIVMDDLNSVSDRGMKPLFSLPCHILVTTRIHPSLWGLQEGILVGSLSDHSELDDFIKQYSRRSLSAGEYALLKNFYDYVGGHTLLMKIAVSSIQTPGAREALSPIRGLGFRREGAFSPPGRRQKEPPEEQPEEQSELPEKQSNEQLDERTEFPKRRSGERSKLPEEIMRDIFSRFPLKPKEKQVMRELSFLPARGISLEFYLKISEHSAGILKRLSTFMLINIDANHWISLHPLVAQAARQVFAPTLSSCQRMVGNFCDSLSEMWTQTRRQNQEMEPYVFAILNTFPQPVPQMLRQLEQLATWLWIQEYYKESEQYCARIVSCAERYYGPLHQLTGELYLRMAAVYHNSLDNTRAKIWYQKGFDVLKTCEYRDERYNRILSMAYIKMAREYMADGSLTEALTYIQTAQELEETFLKQCGVQPSDASARLENRSDYIKSDHTEQHSGTSERLEETADLHSILLNKAQILLRMKRIEDGKSICLETRKNISQLYPDSFRLNEFDLTLIDFLMAEGSMEEAELLCRDCLNHSMLYRGPHFKDTLDCVEKLADICAARGLEKEAAELYTRLYSELSAHFPSLQDRIRRALENSGRLR